MADIEKHEDEGAKAFDPRLARRLFAYLKPYRFRAALSVFLVIVSSLFEIAGPAITAIAIDLYVKPLQGANPMGVSRRAGDWLASHGWALDPISGINLTAIVYLFTLVGGFAILYSQMVLMNLMGQYIMYDLRRQIFTHLQRLDIQFFDRNPVGRLMTRVTTDVDALNDLFTAGFVAIFGDIFVLLGIVGVLFWMNWRLALVLFSITPFIVLVSIWFRRGARVTYRKVRARIAAINAFLQEHISGMSTVQLFNREEKEAEKFDALNRKHRDANIESIFYYAVFYPVIELIETIGVALIVWYGGGKVIQGTLSVGALVAFFQYSQRFYRGERIALVGHTGAGKTTVTSLLLRFYEPQRGEILINGIDFREYYLESLRRSFAIVQQDLFLFTGNVADNISLADPAISPEMIRTAALRVQADRFISRLPDGYASQVRERGAGLSVGEKQLLSFARALAFNPPVLILDEATSSIDTETELLIQEAIQTLLEGRTSLVIAHRLSTIRSADSILVFHHGEIRERGTHDQLMEHGGLYRRLYEIQYREAVAV